MKESLDFKLKRILQAINDLARTTTMISINAGITASKITTSQGRAFQIIAGEIRKLSGDSIRELAHLETVLKDVRTLYNILNIAGRQRMLSQKIMKLKLLEATDPANAIGYQKERQTSIALFEDSLEILERCHINTPAIKELLDKGNEIWLEFTRSLKADEIGNATALNETLLYQMNEITKAYEELSS